jgi:hypothetical protein
MIEQGVDIYTVKEFLGHKSLTMTEKYVKIYLSSLKAKYDAYRVKKQKTSASESVSELGCERTERSQASQKEPDGSDLDESLTAGW